MLRALLQACHAVDPGDATSDEEAAALQRAMSLCMHEIRRQGVFQVEPASTNEVLRQREAVLQRCVQSLSATLEQWGAAVEAEPARLGADAAPAEPAELELPELPNLAEQLARLQGVAALHADQAELTLRRVGAMVDESAVQRKQLAASAHHTSFSGYVSVNEPKLLIRSLVCP